jgi:CheY-like chemotaxis protein
MHVLFLIAGMVIGLSVAWLATRPSARRSPAVAERLAKLSHDLRTPIASIVAYAEILEDEEEADPETRRRFLRIVREEASRMLRMIEELTGGRAGAAGTAAPPAEGASSSTEPARGTVLVVDDDPFLVSATRRLLVREGFQALSAGGGQEAVEQARLRRPDLILMDLSMPAPGGMGGEEALRALRADPGTSSIPVIITTGSAGVAAPSGAAAILTKPISRDVLLSTLGRVLEGPR